MASKSAMQQFVDSIWRASSRQEKKKANHSLLPQYSSPTISASTTVTNFSSIQSLNKYEKYIPVSKMTIKEKNMLIGAGEIAPLKIGENEKSAHHFPEDQVGLTLEPSINGKYSPYNETTEPNPSYAKQVLAAMSVSLGSMTVGFVSAYTSPAIASMNRPNSTLKVTIDEASWIGSLMPLAALVGGIAGGSLIETIGRKKTILFTAFPFIMSWLLIAFAVNVPMLYAARVLAGFSVGVASLGLPVYLGETVQPEVRGTLGLLPTALGNIGILLCFTAGNYLNWSELAILGACLPIPFLLLMFIIPETPRWFMNKNKPKQARKALQWLRGKADVSIEFDKLQKSSSSSESSACSDLFQKQNIKPLAICLGLMFFQQMSGINAIIFYTVMIFQNAGSTIDENLCTIIVGVVNFGSTFVATILIDRLGRKVLLLTSSVSMTITLLILGTFFFIGSQGYDVTDYGWLPLVSFVIFVIGFSVGYGPIPWLMMGEILPSRIRGGAASICTAFNWACTFMVTKTFTDVITLIGTHGAFWMFGTICLIAIGFTIICVPETRGRSLEDIEKTLTGMKVRRMSSIANLKPLPTAC